VQQGCDKQVATAAAAKTPTLVRHHVELNCPISLQRSE
jgi:hypothetical protein